MANPQKENGYTAIANEVLEQLVKIPLLGSEFSLILFVIRKTWGWGKKEDFISLTQFQKGLSLSRPTITKTIKNMVTRKLLVKGYSPDRQKIAYKFNKYYNQWLVNPPELVKYTSLTSKEKLQKLVKVGLHTKETQKKTKGREKFLEAGKQLIGKRI